MKKHGYVFLFLVFGTSLLFGCLNVTSLWTGATLIYDRHNVYKKISDYDLSANAHRALYRDMLLKQKGCALDLAIFNGDILLAGYVPTQALRQYALSRIQSISGYRRIFNQLKVGKNIKNGLLDSWITTQIRARIFADAAIDPNAFKVVTSDRIVYLMGDVRPNEADRVIYIARTTEKVERVVKLFKYYNLSKYAVADN